MSDVQIIGRSSSHFTRVTLIFAHELAVPFELVPVADLTSLDESSYASNPARKLPTLRRGGSLVFGAENICRALAEMAPTPPHIVWPEQLTGDPSRNANEMAWHCMAAQVQLAFGTIIAGLPADNVYFVKGRVGFEGALSWLERNLDEALDAMPASRQLSLFEVVLFCLVEHIAFRQTVPLTPYPSLLRFAQTFATRDSAQRTPYRFDAPRPG